MRNFICILDDNYKAKSLEIKYKTQTIKDENKQNQINVKTYNLKDQKSNPLPSFTNYD